MVVRHPDMGKSGPHRAYTEASRWPILAPMSALPATGAGRWARHGPRGPMGSVGASEQRISKPRGAQAPYQLAHLLVDPLRFRRRIPPLRE